jgi:hypothetical protein
VLDAGLSRRKLADIHLLKLHGSIDWILKSKKGLGGLQEMRVALAGDPSDTVPGGMQYSPALIFGARGKLRADGPFLAMLRAFNVFLADADRLLVVGYSFRDEHINTAIRRWFNRDPTLEIVVIDPSFNPVAQRSRRPPRALQTSWGTQ